MLWIWAVKTHRRVRMLWIWAGKTHRRVMDRCDGQDLFTACPEVGVHFSLPISIIKVIATGGGDSPLRLQMHLTLYILNGTISHLQKTAKFCKPNLGTDSHKESLRA